MSPKKPMLAGRELSDEELQHIRTQLDSFDTIEAVSDEMRTLIAEQWPELLGKIEPKRKN